MIKRDYLERLIEELAALTQRVLGGESKDPRRELDDFYPQVGVPALVLDRLDAASIRMMSGDKLEALIELLEVDAQLSETLGDEARARRRRALAKALA